MASSISLTAPAHVFLHRPFTWNMTPADQDHLTCHQLADEDRREDSCEGSTDQLKAFPPAAVRANFVRRDEVYVQFVSPGGRWENRRFPRRGQTAAIRGKNASRIDLRTVGAPDAVAVTRRFRIRTGAFGGLLWTRT